MSEPPSPGLLLDTCAAIWLVNGDRMTAASRRAISSAQDSGAGIYISPITAWEIGTLVARKRINLSLSPDAWFERLLDLPGIRLAAMTPAILIASAMLPATAPRDPADRIIAATARTVGVPIVTRDRDLTRYGRAGHIGVIPC